MTTKKPLHVRVAEALGWAEIAWQWADARWEEKEDPDWAGVPPEPNPHLRLVTIPRYDTDWAATGPLIERYVRFLERINESGPLAWGARTWDPEWGMEIDPNQFLENGPTPLVAVCNLILALHAAGKLPKEQK